MNFDEALALITRELGAVPIPLDVLRVDLWAPRTTPGDIAVLKGLFAKHPGDHPVEVTLHNGIGGKTLLAPAVTVDIDGIVLPIVSHFGAWAVGL